METERNVYEAAKRLVSENVHYCVSSLVYAMTQHVGDLSRQAQDDIGFTCDDAVDLWRRAPDAGDYRDCAPHSLQVRQDGDSWKWKDGEGMWSPPFDSEIEAFRDAFEDMGEDEPDGADVFEHWIISDWLASKLEERGETVARDILGGLTIWGRATSGQAIASDHVIEAITREFYLAREA